jgi:hypothetical protein
MPKNQNPEQFARDKTNLDIFWIKDKSLTDLDNLPDPDILANEIIENIEAGLASFREIMDTVGVGGRRGKFRKFLRKPPYPTKKIQTVK